MPGPLAEPSSHPLAPRLAPRSAAAVAILALAASRRAPSRTMPRRAKLSQSAGAPPAMWSAPIRRKRIRMRRPSPRSRAGMRDEKAQGVPYGSASEDAGHEFLAQRNRGYRRLYWTPRSVKGAAFVARRKGGISDGFRQPIRWRPAVGPALSRYRGRHPVVLALPRGGAPVAAEIAARLDAPLDLILVRKIGAPMQPELAMAAVVDGAAPMIVRNDDVPSDTPGSPTPSSKPPARGSLPKSIADGRSISVGARVRGSKEIR